MKLARSGPLPVRPLLIAFVVTWTLALYARSVWLGDPRPALHGTGLAMVVLNLLSPALLAAGLWAWRPPCAGRGSWLRRHRWAGPVLILAGMAAALALYAVAPDNAGGVFLLGTGVWALSQRLPMGWALVFGTAALFVVWMVRDVVHGREPDYGLLAGFIGVVLGATAARQRRSAEDATRQAEAAALMLDERTRMAREIHDILAHSLSAQLVHLEGARLLLSRDADRTRALDRVERAQNLARAGLEETRRALAALRGDAPLVAEALAGLAEEFHAATGRPANVAVTGAQRELSPQAGLAVVRTAQEALTNVRKHAPGARVRIVLDYRPAEVALEVTDTGSTEPGLDAVGAGLTGAGYGLVGMRERAELIGGTLEAGPEDKGFRVALKVPA
ncbi:sensor histidine kinase [Actinomadura hibisca]|uniref:sensor histidine kinase n=1 Tax=Actinomadura hibisca TaxID=68565 RepID=UPI000835BE64|nr:histidine kinase [Actinomadura hibisca]